MNKYSYKKNWEIRSPTLRLIDSEGKQVGIVTLTKAREIAQEKGLDLVEIAPRAVPPVAKVTNFAKFIYQQEKKEKEERKKEKKGDKLKEIRLRPFIGQADLDNKLERAKEFAQEGDRLKFVVKFAGRQITQKQFGYQLIEKIKQALVDFYEQEGEIKPIGKTLIILMKPVRVKKSESKKTDESQKEK